MAECIEREAAMDIFGDVPMWQGYYEPYPWEVHCAIVGIVKLLKEEISKIPAADVAPVVRCKDCKHHYDCGVHFCDRLGMDCPDDSDFFCSYGERKDGDSNALD